jgi:hypothetical protein
MDQAAEDVHALDRPVTDWLRQAGGNRRLQVQAAVGPTPVVVLDVGLQDLVQVGGLRMRIQSRHSVRALATQRSV